MREISQTHQDPNQPQGGQGEMEKGGPAFAYHIPHGETDIAGGALLGHGQGSLGELQCSPCPRIQNWQMLKIMSEMSFSLIFVTI